MGLAARGRWGIARVELSYEYAFRRPHGGPVRQPRALAVAFLLAGAVSAEEPPTMAKFARRGSRSLGLPPVAGEPTVARHLDTGLTTIFLLAVEGRGGPKLAGAAHVTVRYDLWDEVYAVGGQDAQGDRPATSLPSRAALLDWWRALVLVVAPTGPSPPYPARPG